jgi:hypothetical protein
VHAYRSLKILKRLKVLTTLGKKHLHGRNGAKSLKYRTKKKKERYFILEFIETWRCVIHTFMNKRGSGGGKFIDFSAQTRATKII